MLLSGHDVSIFHPHYSHPGQFGRQIAHGFDSFGKVSLLQSAEKTGSMKSGVI